MKKADFFQPLNRIIGSEQVYLSPNQRYTLWTQRYRTGEHSWEYSQGEVYRRYDADHPLATIQRNYSHFWHAWVEQHSMTGHDYLLCGEDYQGYTIATLDTQPAQIQSYRPPEAAKGNGFCWAACYPSPDGLLLAVYGCYWAGPTELVFYDFRQPEILPLPELSRIDDPNDAFLDAGTWFDATHFQYRRWHDDVWIDDFDVDDEEAVEMATEAVILNPWHVIKKGENV